MTEHRETLKKGFLGDAQKLIHSLPQPAQVHLNYDQAFEVIVEA
ncbi:14744_t:CDS:2 [Cetraspora pellucida]|uniref:14744_t:CDS:1 n=1 Tax=Cetraspora pellucida TaxID=1433469 RepID=A0A9N8YUK6_9GLOM|nr:14744_t:CDS:2 [Cetraspora pellucida]